MDRPTLVERIAREIARDVVRGDLRPGTRLPPLRALAGRFGVTLPTAHRAAARLQEMGLVEVRHGSGMRVRDPRTAAGPDLLSIRIEAHLRDPEEAARVLADFLELRRLVAVALLRRVRLRKEDAAEIARLAGEMEASPERAVEIDLRIVRILLDRAGQVAFAAVFNSFERLLLTVPALVAAMYDDPRRNAAGWRAFAAADPAALEPLAAQGLAAIDRRTVSRFRTLLEKTP